jgi:rubrerythrin
MDIADEEIVHAGEFLTLLKELSPREESLYAEGALEVQEMMNGQQTETAPSEEEGAEEATEVKAHPQGLTVGGLMEEG